MSRVWNQLLRTAGISLGLLLIAGDAAAEICINVDLKFTGHQPPAVTVQSIQKETSAIWKPYGVQIQWSGSEQDAQCSLVHGTFDVRVEYRPTPAGDGSGLTVLGSTHLVPAGIDHAGICVDYSKTEHLLESMSVPQLFGLLGRPDVGPADMGRALGRVLAHEIGHVVLGVSRHPSGGLMRRAFTAEELVARHRTAYTLSKKEIERLGLREQELRKYQAPDHLNQ